MAAGSEEAAPPRLKSPRSVVTTPETVDVSGEVAAATSCTYDATGSQPIPWCGANQRTSDHISLFQAMTPLSSGAAFGSYGSQRTPVEGKNNLGSRSKWPEPPESTRNETPFIDQLPDAKLMLKFNAPRMGGGDI